MRAKPVANLLLDRKRFVCFRLHNVYPGLVLVHGVQNKLEGGEGGIGMKPSLG